MNAKSKLCANENSPFRIILLPDTLRASVSTVSESSTGIVLLTFEDFGLMVASTARRRNYRACSKPGHRAHSGSDLTPQGARNRKYIGRVLLNPKTGDKFGWFINATGASAGDGIDRIPNREKSLPRR